METDTKMKIPAVPLLVTNRMALFLKEKKSKLESIESFYDHNALWFYNPRSSSFRKGRTGWFYVFIFFWVTQFTTIQWLKTAVTYYPSFLEVRNLSHGVTGSSTYRLIGLHQYFTQDCSSVWVQTHWLD